MDNKDKLNVSTWLTVIETCRLAPTHLSEFEKLAVKRFDEIYDPSLFNTDSGEDLNSSEKKKSRPVKPKSVLINKRE